MDNPSRSTALETLGQHGVVVWLTGLSGSGKTTTARALAKRLERAGKLAYVVDGDGLRADLSSDLGFSPADRAENVRRAGKLASILAEAGLIVIVALISPYRADRDAVRYRVGAERFFEVHVSTPVEECERRDSKSLYSRARSGELRDFTGISSPYEEPLSPILRIDTSRATIDEAVEMLFRLLENHGAIDQSGPEVRSS